MVTRSALLANPCLARHKCHIYQTHKAHEAFIGIGKKPVLEPLEGVRHTHPIKRALYYQQLLDEGKVDSHAELARHLGVVRSRVSTVLNVLNLDKEIQDFLLLLEDGDGRLEMFNELECRLKSEQVRRGENQVEVLLERRDEAARAPLVLDCVQLAVCY